MKAILLLSPFTLQPTIAAVTPSPAAGWGKSPLSSSLSRNGVEAAIRSSEKLSPHSLVGIVRQKNYITIFLLLLGYEYQLNVEPTIIGRIFN